MIRTTPLAITINRQLGSGGSYIGQQIAKKMGILYADREIISEAATQLSVLETDIESRDEKILSFWHSFWQFSAFAPTVYEPPKTLLPTNRELFDVESEIIKRIASEQSVVIIGRCGFHILKDHPNRLSIYLYGDIGFRVARVAELYSIPEKEAEKMVIQTDKERANYCKYFTDKKWTDARNYDLSIDTSKAGIEQSVELILSYLKMDQ